MIPLPIDPHLSRIMESLKANRSLVLVASPGAGKTTRVPPALLRSDLLAPGSPGVILLQPRRVATRATAYRIAEEQGWTLGGEVGYQVRLERKISARTRLRIQTEGILNRQLLADPFLEGIGAVILDEFHERNLHSDLAIALLKEIRREVRPDLIVVVMSATIDGAGVSRFLDDCAVLHVEGRAHPVVVRYQEALRPASPEAVAPLVREALEKAGGDGHILVFLPGMAEIRRVADAIGSLAREHQAEVHLLHGSLSSEDQDRAIRPGGRRKIILATNIAETSITIDGVTTVIDSGLARIASHDPVRGFDRLDLGTISQASADQRAGRAGRTAPGNCIRLWTEQRQRLLPAFDQPEIHRVDLASTVLALHAWGARDVREFQWYEPPAIDRVEASERLLTMLGAVDPERQTITPLGRRMLDLPVHPRLARLLIAAAEENHTEAGAAIAALISEKPIALREATTRRQADAARERGRCDLFPMLDLLHEAEAARFGASLRDREIDPVAARQAARVRDDLIRVASRIEARAGESRQHVEADADSDEALLQLLILAYPDRLVRRRGSEETGVMVGGRGVRLSPQSVVREGELFLALDPRETRRQGVLELEVRLASHVQLDWIEKRMPALLRTERDTRYDPDRERVVSLSRLWYQDLLLREDVGPPSDADAASSALATALRDRASSIFLDDPAVAAWLARVALLRDEVSELDWPALDDSAFVELLEALCRGKTRLSEVMEANKLPALESTLDHSLRRELALSAPLSLKVPSGRDVALTYEMGRPPVLAVRLQELFGWTETPRVARGRVPVLLHLLGPNYRPVQITSDLKSFWTTTYHQVRKDLRARYPKHSWPEDPLTAQPASGPRRKHS